MVAMSRRGTDASSPRLSHNALGTVAARCLVFPLIVKGQREAMKLNNHLPQINELTARINAAKRSGNKFECEFPGKGKSRHVGINSDF